MLNPETASVIKIYREVGCQITVSWKKNGISKISKSTFLIKSENINKQRENQGLVVQSVVSLTSSLRGQLVKCFTTL